MRYGRLRFIVVVVVVIGFRLKNAGVNFFWKMAGWDETNHKQKNIDNEWDGVDQKKNIHI